MVHFLVVQTRSPVSIVKNVRMKGILAYVVCFHWTLHNPNCTVTIYYLAEKIMCLRLVWRLPETRKVFQPTLTSDDPSL